MAQPPSADDPSDLPLDPLAAPGGGSAEIDDDERMRRWRLLIGPEADAQRGLTGTDVKLDAAMGALYDDMGDGAVASRRQGGLGASAPSVARWLGDIRAYFPNRVVQVMQKDAVDRLGIASLLLEPELMESVEPNVHLVGTLLTLKGQIPERTKATARTVVGKMVEEIEKRVATKTQAAVSGALNRATRTRRPRLNAVDWNATIKANLANYLPEHRTVVPERLIGYGRRQQTFSKEIVLAIDQSGSMAPSVVYSAVFGSVLASIRALKTSVVVFDTEVVDLTELLSDPVDVLFGTQLGGGTDINRAIAYCQDLITRPREAVFVLISDLYEGGIQEEMLRRMHSLVEAGVQVVVLLALSDEGAPSYDHENAAALAELGIAAFACTPDAFPDLLALALTGGDIAAWAEREQLSQR